MGRAMASDECISGWSYRVEHPKDFAWGGGDTGFILALSGDEADRDVPCGGDTSGDDLEPGRLTGPSAPASPGGPL